jgi:hypothetical protein
MSLATVNTLIKEGRLAGSVSGRVYVPDIFDVSRKAWVESFYAANNYVEYSQMDKLYYNKPRATLEGMFTNGIPLSGCYLNKSYVTQLDAVCDEALQSESWTDIRVSKRPI